MRLGLVLTRSRRLFPLAALLVACAPGDGPGEPACAVASVSVAPAQVTLSVGETITLIATIATTGCASTPPVTWSSANPSQASVAGRGTQATVTALAPTTTPVSITASAGSHSDAAPVTVTLPPTITLSAANLTFTATQGGADPAGQSITVTNGGGQTLTGLAVGTITYSAGATGWLQAPSLSGTTASPSVTLTLQPVTGALTAGTYTATVPVQAAVATNSPQDVAVTFVVGPAPDLLLTALTAPAAGIIGQLIPVATTVHNQGTAAAGPFRVRFYYSSDAAITTADETSGAGCDYPAGLAAGTSATCSLSIPVPGTLAPGTYFVGAIADDLDQVPEILESNNARASATGTDLAALPDLSLDVVTAPATGVAGGTIAALATVRNQGLAAAGAFQITFYYSTDAVITTADISSGGGCVYASGLAANTVSDCNGPIPVPLTLPAGSYFVGAIVDPLDQVAESDEANNARAAAGATATTTKPDLVVDVMTAPAAGVVGSPIAVQATVRNQGSAAVTQVNTRVGIYLSSDTTISTADTFIGHCAIGALAVNATYDCSGPVIVPGTLAPGTYYAGAIADDQAFEDEIDEGNNSRASATATDVSAPPAGGPDYTVEAVTAPAIFTLGTVLDLSATVRNIGAATSDSSRLTYFISPDPTISAATDVEVAYCDLPGLAANGTVICSDPVTPLLILLPGTYYIGAVADVLGQIVESDESNNILGAANATEIRTGPDLVLESVTAPATGVLGSTINVQVFFTNLGIATESSSRVTVFYSTDSIITTSDVTSNTGCIIPAGFPYGLPSACSGAFPVPRGLPPGTYYVGAIVDELSQVAESDETNNAGASPTTTLMSIPALPDLVVYSISSSQVGIIGDTISAVATVHNLGASTAGPFRMQFYFSTDRLIRTSDVPTGSTCVFGSGLAFNATATCNIPVAVPASLTAGVYHLGAIVDDLGQVAESDENGNWNVSSNATTLVTAHGSPASVTINAGNGQTAAPGTSVAIPPSVIVRDSAGNPVPFVNVSLRSILDGWTVGALPTDANGIAFNPFWPWTLSAGANVLEVTVDGYPNIPPAVFSARGDASPADFDVALRFLTVPTLAQLQAFNAALARWESIITGDLADIGGFVVPAGTCTPGSPAISEDVDDLVIEVAFEPIDGAGGVLGSAAPCIVRTTGSLPVLGTMRFDVADLATLEASGELGPVVLHEMGHVFGIGSLWSTFGLLADPSLPSNPGVDTRFTGTNGIAGFDAVGGTTYTGGGKVPVENTQGGQGTQDAHWRESVLANELMTGFLNTGMANPLSELTVRSLVDLGYTVDTAAGDSFFLTLSLREAVARAGGLRMLNDVSAGPIYRVDQNGRITDLQGRATQPTLRRQ